MRLGGGLLTVWTVNAGGPGLSMPFIHDHLAMLESDVLIKNGGILALTLRFLSGQRLGTAAIVILSVALLAGCATKALRAARDECRSEAFNKYPTDNIQVVGTSQRAVQVPTGQTNCTYTPLGGSITSRCVDVMRTEYVSYQDVHTVDRNQGGRDNFVWSCSRNLCQTRFGNPECKAGG